MLIRPLPADPVKKESARQYKRHLLKRFEQAKLWYIPDAEERTTFRSFVNQCTTATLATKDCLAFIIRTARKVGAKLIRDENKRLLQRWKASLTKGKNLSKAAYSYSKNPIGWHSSPTGEIECLKGVEDGYGDDDLDIRENAVAPQDLDRPAAIPPRIGMTEASCTIRSLTRERPCTSN